MVDKALKSLMDKRENEQRVRIKSFPLPTQVKPVVTSVTRTCGLLDSSCPEYSNVTEHEISSRNCVMMCVGFSV